MQKTSITMDLFFLDASIGDTIVIKFPNGNIGLIDSCMFTPDAQARYIKFIESQLYDEAKIEFICLTHPHKDHFAGLLSVLTHFDKRIKSFWYSADYIDEILDYLISTHPSDDEDSFNRSWGELFDIQEMVLDKYKIENLIPGKKIQVGAVDFRALSPGPSEGRNLRRSLGRSIGGFLKTRPDWNVISTSLLLNYGGKSLVLGGDALKSVWSWYGVEDILTQDATVPRSISLYKVPHHGSNNAYAPEFFERKCTNFDRTHLIVTGRDENELINRDLDIMNHKNEKGYKIHFVASEEGEVLDGKISDTHTQLVEDSKAVRGAGQGGIRARIWEDGRIRVNYVNNLW